MLDDPRGPIQHFSWGAFVIGGEEHSTTTGAGKDIRVVGDDVSPWRERKGHKLKRSMITGVYDRDVDVLVFDVQDVGTRIYTYIATMAYCMEASAENVFNYP